VINIFTTTLATKNRVGKLLPKDLAGRKVLPRAQRIKLNGHSKRNVQFQTSVTMWKFMGSTTHRNMPVVLQCTSEVGFSTDMCQKTSGMLKG